MGKDDDNSPFFHPQSQGHSYDINNKIMLTAIISLSVVVVVVTILHLYARCVLRRQARRRAAILWQLGITGSARVHSGESPKTGLDPIVIASLPIFAFNQTIGKDEMEAIECSVCLSMLEDGEMARPLPNCKHTFHAECINKWLSSHSTCPVCRTEAQPRLSPEPREPAAGIPPPTAPPLDRVNSAMEGTSETAAQSLAKVSESNSRLSSFRRILSRERSSRRIQSCEEIEDLERQ